MPSQSLFRLIYPDFMRFYRARAHLEFLLLVEEHAEADNGSVNQKTANYGHSHGLNCDEAGVREDNGKSCTRISHVNGIAPCAKPLLDLEQRDLPIPITTKNPVKKRPRSRTAAPELSTKSSGLAQCPQIQLGMGAMTKVATTRRG